MSSFMANFACKRSIQSSLLPDQHCNDAVWRACLQDKCVPDHLSGASCQGLSLLEACT